MIKSYFNKILKGIITLNHSTKKNKRKGRYHIKTWFGGRLYKSIGIKNALEVKELTISGKINITDLYFILHMDNLEILNLKNASYSNKKQNEIKINHLRRKLLKDKKHLKEICFRGFIP